MVPLTLLLTPTVVCTAMATQPIDFFSLPYEQQVTERDRLVRLPDGPHWILTLLSSGNHAGTDGELVLTNGLVRLGSAASPAVLFLLQKPDVRFGYWMNRWAESLPKDEADRVARLLAVDPRITSTLVSGVDSGYMLRPGSPALDIAMDHLNSWPRESRSSLYGSLAGDPRLTAFGIELILRDDRTDQLEGLRLLASARHPNPALEDRLLLLLKKQTHTYAPGRVQALQGFADAAAAYALHAKDPAAAYDLLRSYVAYPECAAGLTRAMTALRARGVDVADTLAKLAPTNEDHYMGHNRAVEASRTRDGTWEADFIKRLASTPPAQRLTLTPFFSELKAPESKAEFAGAEEEKEGLAGGHAARVPTVMAASR